MTKLSQRGCGRSERGHEQETGEVKDSLNLFLRFTTKSRIRIQLIYKKILSHCMTYYSLLELVGFTA